MKRSLRAKGRALSIFLVLAGALGICCGFSSVAYGVTSPEPPAHEKTLTSNDDGTYTLSLSVTGAATSTTESNDINVVVIFDTSSSMGNSVDGGGTRRSNAIIATEAIAANLLGKNTTANSDAVQMALITFNSTATVSQGWTTSASLFDSSLEHSSTAYGTNWEAALSAAYSLANDGDPTYVIFVTDGQPTMSLGSTSISTQNSATYAHLASTYARALVTGTAGTVTGPTSTGGQNTSLAGKGYTALYGIYAYGTEVDYLDDVIDYANGNAWSAGTGTRVVSNYYRASSTTALQDALTSILTSITTDTSYQGVTITDGLTGMTQSTTVDGKVSDFTYTITSASGEKTVVTLNDEGKIATIDGSATSSSKTLTDSVGNTLTLTIGDAFPGATNTDGTVTWDTSTLPTTNAAGVSTPGALLGGFTYTVSFVVWPSQDAYDLVAQLENGTVSYGDLTAAQQAQLVETDTGYGLKTNTEAEVAYTAVTSVTTNGTTTTTKLTGTSSFASPDPIALVSTTLTVDKAWVDDLNSAADRPDSITLEVTQDGKDFSSVTLNEDNDWTATVHIAPGIVVTPGDYGTDATGDGVLESGHAYSVSEATDSHYQLSVTPVQPMINGTTTDDTTDLVDFLSDTVWTGGEASLTATNTLKGRLDVSKIVVGDDVDPDDTFTFVIALTDSEGNTVSTDTNTTLEYLVYDADGSESSRGTIDDGTATVAITSSQSILVVDIPTGTSYSVYETDIPDGYMLTSASGATGTIAADTQASAAFTNTYETTDISITKTWEDSNDQDGIRPIAEDYASMVSLFADGTEVAGVTPDVVDNLDGTYTVTFAGLPKTTSATSESGVTTTRDIVYTVEETDVPEGYATSDASVADGGAITNTHTPATTSVTATKVWDDSDNQDGIRADVTLHLTKTVDEVTSVVEGQDRAIAKDATGDDLTVTWNDLPVYENGSKITYSVTEDAIDGYSSTIAPIAVDEGASVTVTNTHTPEVTTLSGSKTWDDADDQDGIRPDNVTVHLLADGVDTGKSATVSADDNWQWSFEGLPMYASGTKIAYTISEDSVTDYESSYNGMNVTNTHTPETTSVSGTKVWDDGSNQDGKRPTSVVITLTGTVGEGKVVSTASKTVTGTGDTWTYSFADLPKYSGGQLITYTVSEAAENVPEGYASSVDGYTVTNTHTPEVVSVSGSKTWDDANDQDGKRPGEITVRLTGSDGSSHETTTNAAKDWKYSFNNLPKYSQGTEITYTLTEDAVADYGTTYDGYDVTNSYAPGETSVSVTKLWNDGSDQDGIRPDSVTVQLYADGVAYGEPVELSESNNWTYAWTSLPINRSKSSDTDATAAVVYAVKETSTPDGYAPAVSGDATKGFTVTNTHTPATTSVSATKTWDDADDQDGIRPASITYHLLADGVEIDSQTVGADDGWSHAWTGLPVYGGGEAIAYTVTEDAVAGYATSSDASVTDDGASFSFTNTHTPEVVSVSGTKTWADGDDQDGIRPDSVTVSLLANGTVVETAEATAGNGWSYSFADLPKYSSGVEISYSVEEVPVPGYQATASGFDLTNTHVPATGDITVTKVWSDSNDKDGIRPASVTVRLYADGVDTGRSVTLSADDSWTATFSGLATYDGGSGVTYSVVEDAVSGYTAAYTSESAGSITVTNTHVPTVTPKVPDTGDSTATGMGILAIIGAATVLAGYRRRRDE